MAIDICDWIIKKFSNPLKKQQIIFQYRVKKQDRCEGLKRFSANKIFKGVVQWSNTYNEFYLTTDGITYTKLDKAHSVKQVGDIQ